MAAMRKSLLAAAAGLAALALPLFAAPAPASRFGIDFSVSPQPGLTYAGSFDPGYSGTAVAVTPFWQAGLLRIETGIEAGSSPLGWQVLAPVRAGTQFLLPPLSLEVIAEAAPGAALFQQGPLLVLGAGALVRVTWNPLPRFGIFASAGIRYTICPSYKESTGVEYSTLDVPLSLGIRWTFKGRE
jgi:hypothetical protein